jgi:pre-mRNA-splicing factor SYF1
MPPKRKAAGRKAKETPQKNAPSSSAQHEESEPVAMEEALETDEHQATPNSPSAPAHETPMPMDSLDIQRANKMQELLKLIEERDLVYEEDILRHPYQLKSWLRYIDHHQKAPSSTDKLLFLYERAVQEFPMSYKLWKGYLDLRLGLLLAPPGTAASTKDKKQQVQKGQKAALDRVMELLQWKRLKPLSDLDWLKTNSCFEQALILCNKFPILWLKYLAFLMHQKHQITVTRRTFDRALQSLPLTQHPLIWKLYLVFAEQVGGETCVRIWRRYLKLNSSALEDYPPILLGLEPPRYAEAARVLARLVAHASSKRRSKKSMFQLWSELAELVTEHPDEIDQVSELGGADLGATLDVDSILRAGIQKFTDQVGKIWNSLARWWILKGEWEKARDVYEEALGSVMTVRDFSMVFDTYAKMEEDILSAQMTQLEDNGPSPGVLEETDVDIGLARFERLMERRPFLLSDVLLRQNPHNVTEWTNRIQLWKDRQDFEKVVETYILAFNAISPKKAAGSLPQLWIDFAQFYLDSEEVDKARQVYERAVTSPFKKVEDLEQVWANYGEMEVELGEPQNALALLGRALAPPKSSLSFQSSVRFNDESHDPSLRLFKSLKLWSFFVDLEESVGTLDSTRAAYDRILELKIATPQIVVNYATFLEEQNYFEEVRLS